MKSLWFRILLIVLALPAFAYPTLLADGGSGNPTMRTLLWAYPLYVLGTVVCAWACYPARKEVAWILAALLLLSQIAIFYLCL